MNEIYRRSLLAMQKKDHDTLEVAMALGYNQQGYNQRLEKVHKENKERFETLYEKFGFPGISVVGKDGNAAAFLICQHAIAFPDFFKKMYQAFRANSQDAFLVYQAYMEDRINYYERKPQRYGTQFNYDLNGIMKPWMIEDETQVDALRKSLGMDTLAERMKLMSDNNPYISPTDAKRFLENEAAWLKQVGWIK